MALVSYQEARQDRIARMEAACHHVRVLWRQRHSKLPRIWLREYLFTLQIDKDELGIRKMRCPEVVEP